MHHRFKRDAPSGTARTLAEILAEVRRQQAEQVLRHRPGRDSLARGTTEGNGHALASRGRHHGGPHGRLCGRGERCRDDPQGLQGRETFATGALSAALWVARQPPGLYDMQDVLGLK